MDDRTEFERTLSALEGLTRGQIADCVLERLSQEDARSFHVLSEGLSIEALRFVSARALFRMRRISRLGALPRTGPRTAGCSAAGPPPVNAPPGRDPPAGDS